MQCSFSVLQLSALGKRITEGIFLTLSEIWVLPWQQPQSLRARQSLAMPIPGSSWSNYPQTHKSWTPLLAGRWDLHPSGSNVLTWLKLCLSYTSSAPTAQLPWGVCQDKSYKAERPSWPHSCTLRAFYGTDPSDAAPGSLSPQL